MEPFLIFVELILLALWCKSIEISTWPGMILHRVDMEASRLPVWLYKPLIGCIYCMASVHGTLVHAVFCLLFGADPFLLPLVCVCGISANGLFSALFDFIKGKAYDGD